MVAPETAGDPMSAQEWVRSSLRTLSRRLSDAGHRASPPTVRRVLKKRDYALHVNAKKTEARSDHPERDAQFTHIGEQRAAGVAAGQPIIRVDTKKKELIGNVKNAGQAWSQDPEAVNAHDFLSDAQGRAVPYGVGVYDVTRNRGTVYVGSSGDTSPFAVDAIAAWWDAEGRVAYPAADHLLILADGGGSNGYRPRLWKQRLQETLCDGVGLSVSVCPYPTGCSKWTPIEHRLFGPISVNGAGKPSRTWEGMLASIRGTTAADLQVEAARLDGLYPTGLRVSDAEMDLLNRTPHDVCPSWHYTLYPRSRPASAIATPTPNREVIV